jgi:predicted permease
VKHTVEQLLQDVGYALRGLVRARLFAIAAIATIALPIAGNASIFGIVNALLLRLPNVHQPRELLGIYSDFGPKFPIRHGSVSYPDYEYLRDHTSSFSGVVAYNDLEVVMGDATDAAVVPAQLVSGSFFSVLGLNTIVGRSLGPADDRPGAEATVVIDDRLWKTRLASASEVVGKTLRLNNQVFTIVGVLSPGYTGLTVGPRQQLFMALAAQPLLAGGGGPNMLTSRGNRWLSVVGRRKPGVSEETALADLQTATRQLQQQFPDTNRTIGVAASPVSMVPLIFKGMVFRASAILMAAVAFVLLISCANLANLLLIRANTRRAEFAARLVLGASRARLVRQSLTETLVICLIGGALGFFVATAIASALSVAQAPPGPLALALRMDIDWRVGLFAFGIAAIAGLGVGLLPALWASRTELTSALKQEPLRAGASSRSNRVLLAVQVGVTLVLLTGAGLALRSLANAQAVDLGLRAERVHTTFFSLRRQGFNEARMGQFYQQLLDRTRNLPGVEAATYASHLPLGPAAQTKGVALEGRQPPNGTHFQIDDALVGPGYFRTMGIPIVAGTEFADSDFTSAAGRVPIVINETMARQFWPEQDPIGRVVGVKGGGTDATMTIIGVAKNGSYRSLGESPRPFFYLPLLHEKEAPWGKVLVVRTRGNGGGDLASIRREIASLASGLPPARFTPFEQFVSGALFPARLLATLLGAMGGLALFLQAIGLYAVTASSVKHRTREMAIRSALGAPRRALIKTAMGGALLPVAVGLIAGIGVALLVTRSLEGYLYGITPTDVTTFTAMAAFQLAAGLVAASAPLRQTMKLDPSHALRQY